MSTYYEKRLATELPKESAYFNTDRGELWYDIIKEHWVLSPGSDSIEYPSIWWEPVLSPIPSMTLEEAKLAYARSLGYEDWAILSSARGYYGPTICDRDGVSELYLQHNTLSLRQEVEGLKESCVRLQDELFEMRENPNYYDARVKTLQEENERLLSLLNQK